MNGGIRDAACAFSRRRIARTAGAHGACCAGRIETLRLLAVILTVCGLPRVAGAQALGRIEKAHKPPAPSSSTSSSSSSSSSRSSSSGAAWGGAPSSSSSGSGDRPSFVWPCLVLAPWSGYCFYGSNWLRADRTESAESLAPRSQHDDPGTARYGELSGSTFLGATEKVYGYDLSARAFIFVGGLNVSWLRLHEPDSPTLRSLDLVRASLVGAFVAERHVEAHVLMGVDALHGRDWTPAFGPGVEIRTYPLSRLTAGGSVQASIFAEGYPLFDSRLEAGLVLGRIDLRAGARWLFQPVGPSDPAGHVSILGPSVSLLVRLGP